MWYLTHKRCLSTGTKTFATPHWSTREVPTICARKGTGDTFKAECRVSRCRNREDATVRISLKGINRMPPAFIYRLWRDWRFPNSTRAHHPTWRRVSWQLLNCLWWLTERSRYPINQPFCSQRKGDRRHGLWYASERKKRGFVSWQAKHDASKPLRQAWERQF